MASRTQNRPLERKKGYHECEVFRGQESQVSESEQKWQKCEKNPGHADFLTAKQFKRDILPLLKSPRVRQELEFALDRTVRLRVHKTSLERPDDDELAGARGCNNLRTGTGFVSQVSDVAYHCACPCVTCDGKKTGQHWTFCVDTALHVVYNTEEALETKVDLFFDSDRSDRDGRMKSVWGIKVVDACRDRDLCRILCATHDEDLVERIRSAWMDRHDRMRPNVTAANLETGQIFCRHAVVISHPHGQRKRVTHGEVTHANIEDVGVQYKTPTCSGSSGAPVFLFEHSLYQAHVFLSPLTPTHSGSCSNKSTGGDEEQLNYGHLKIQTG